MITSIDLPEILSKLADALAVGPALLLSADESATLCGMGRTTFLREVNAGKLPQQICLSEGRALWRRADLEAAIKKLKTRTMTPRRTKQTTKGQHEN